MAQLTFVQLVGEVGAWLDLDVTAGGDGDTTVRRCLNWGARRIWTDKYWYERRGQVHLATVAPYTDGTTDFTLASASVAGTATTWTTGMTGRKIALSLGSPWYRFSRTGNTTGTLGDVYGETTALLSTYTIYQDELDIATDVDVIRNVSLFRQEWGGRVVGITEAQMDGGAWVHTTSGLPRNYAITNSVTAGTRRIRLYPVPDAIYRVRVQYWKSYTDMSADSDLCVLGQNKELVLMKAACLEAQNYGAAKRKVTSQEEVAYLIDRAWKTQEDRVPVNASKVAFDSMEDSGVVWMDATHAFDT